MAVAKITEITAGSPKSFDDAIAQGIARAAQTLDGIQRAWVQEQYVSVKDGKVDEYRVNMKISFILKD